MSPPPGKFRREPLSSQRFLSLEDLQQALETWRQDYNTQRPHSSAAGVPPAEFRASGYFNHDLSVTFPRVLEPVFGRGHVFASKIRSFSAAHDVEAWHD